MDSNLIGNKKSLEVYSFAISIALHVLVLTGLAWVTVSNMSGNRGVIRVFISKNEHSQSAGNSVVKSEPAKETVSGKKQSHHAVPVQINDEPAAEISETLMEVPEEKEKEVDRETAAASTLDTDTVAKGENESVITEEAETAGPEFSEDNEGYAISDDGFYIGAFGVENGPRFTKRVQPVYPLFARRAGKEGRVVLQLSIDEEGKLIHIEVVVSAGNGFDDSAVKAIKRSSFSPAMVNGNPIKSRTELPVRFMFTER
jgi:TonB family protein